VSSGGGIGGVRNRLSTWRACSSGAFSTAISGKEFREVGSDPPTGNHFRNKGAGGEITVDHHYTGGVSRAKPGVRRRGDRGGPPVVHSA
jgi:hypothetical protein